MHGREADEHRGLGVQDAAAQGARRAPSLQSSCAPPRRIRPPDPPGAGSSLAIQREPLAQRRHCPGTGIARLAPWPGRRERRRASWALGAREASLRHCLAARMSWPGQACAFSCSRSWGLTECCSGAGRCGRPPALWPSARRRSSAGAQSTAQAKCDLDAVSSGDDSSLCRAPPSRRFLGEPRGLPGRICPPPSAHGEGFLAVDLAAQEPLGQACVEAEGFF